MLVSLLNQKMKPILKEEYSGYQCSEKSKPDQTINKQSGYVVPVK